MNVPERLRILAHSAFWKLPDHFIFLTRYYLGFSSRKLWKKACSTRCSQAVTHLSTDQARRSLSSEIERDREHSTWYGRRRKLGRTSLSFWKNVWEFNRSTTAHSLKLNFADEIFINLFEKETESLKKMFLLVQHHYPLTPTFPCTGNENQYTTQWTLKKWTRSQTKLNKLVSKAQGVQPLPIFTLDN